MVLYSIGLSAQGNVFFGFFFFFVFGFFFFYREESGTSLVTNPTWVVKTCLCLQYLNTELKEMYSDFGKSSVVDRII